MQYAGAEHAGRNWQSYLWILRTRKHSIQEDTGGGIHLSGSAKPGLFKGIGG